MTPESTLATPAPQPTRPQRWTVLGIVSTALLLIVIDMTVLYTALPRLTHDLQASGAEKLWIVNAYSLTMAGLLLGAGTLGDRWGHKRLFLGGLVVFALASLAAAFAPTATVLIGARVALAVGAAMMMPATLAIIRHTFERDDERSLAIGIWAAVASGGAALGPVLGGVLLSSFWWGSVFLINVPIAALALLLGAWLVPSRPGDATRRWDAIGSLQALVALVALAWAIKHLGTRDASWTGTLAAALIAAVAGLMFVRRQRRSVAPLLDLALFRRPLFVTGVAVAVVASIALVGIELVFAQRLQLVLGMTPLHAAYWMLPLAIGAFAAGPLTGWTIRHVGALPMMAGALFVTAAGVAAVWMTLDRHTELLLSLVVLGLGFGGAMTSASHTIIEQAPPHRAGMAASLEEVSYELGGALGVAVLGTVAAALYTRHWQWPAGLPRIDAARSGMDEALRVAERLPPEQAERLLHAARQAFDAGVAGVMGLAVAGLLLAFIAVAALAWQQRRRPCPHTHAGEDSCQA